MPNLTQHLRHSDGVWPLTLVLAYILITYIGGWLLMARPGFLLPALGVIACGHGMVIAAYLVHDCAHNALFKKTEHNTRLGKWLNWVSGGSYGTYEDLRYKHMRHHVDNADPISFDYRAWLKAHPKIEKVIFALEWCYIPAVDILMHAVLMVAPFTPIGNPAHRKRAAAVLVTRFALLATLAVWSVKAVLLYALAYGLALTVLRFFDAYQHNYEIVVNLNDPHAELPHKGNREYEQNNTYSNLVSRRWPVLNLLVLNFCYHNAHHAKPTMPWYKLPALHNELFGDTYTRTVGMKGQVKSYHRNRIAGIYAETYGQVEVPAALRDGKAVPVYGLSFLTAF
ncbi:fatty acid desaturase [Marinobacter vulgaris]|uniref:Fatty acid desaturase n=1 Tax=Marinobacter vulgaris TaxID=1928331 RepID=A0A2V3ZKR6_9GAMM|nr:fatty acid desaturase [Marinobacter vulgaris]PXX89618.1 fatty acid desaturase [Marinobacter vulgaris]TSJ68606.1 fatty acid desaturase [Marinobacter vulgaris]